MANNTTPTSLPDTEIQLALTETFSMTLSVPATNSHFPSDMDTETIAHGTENMRDLIKVFTTISSDQKDLTVTILHQVTTTTEQIARNEIREVLTSRSKNRARQTVVILG